MNETTQPSGILTPTCATWTAEYQAQKSPNWSENYKRTVEYELRRFALFVGQREIDGRVIHEFQAEQFQREAKPKTLDTTFRAAQQFLKWCEEMGYLTKKYSALIPKIKVPREDPVRFTAEQYEKVKELAKGTSLYYATIMAYRTGARSSDVCLLKWENVDMENLVISYVPFKTRKTGAKAVCPFQAGGDLHEVLKELRQSNRSISPLWDQYVCPELAMQCPRGGTYDQGNDMTKRPFKNLCIKIGAPHLSFHKLRNAFCARAVDAGIPFAQVTQMTGLSSFKVLMRYAKPNIDVLRNAMSRIDAGDAPPSGQNLIAFPAA